MKGLPRGLLLSRVCLKESFDVSLDYLVLGCRAGTFFVNRGLSEMSSASKSWCCLLLNTMLHTRKVKKHPGKSRNTLLDQTILFIFPDSLRSS